MERPRKPGQPAYETLVCPYCVHVMDYDPAIKQCSNCQLEIPNRYVRHYKECKPLFLQVFGWSASGKTVYLQTLFLMLRRMQRLWINNNYIFDPANVQARELLEDVTKFGVQLDLPAPTQENLQDAYILLMRNLPRWGGRALVVRDVAGENCTPMEVDTEVMPYLPYAPGTLMFITLGELEKFRHQGQTMDLLVDNYIYTLEQKQIDLSKSRRQIIIVLSKADQLVDDILPKNLSDYLTSDPLWAAATNSYEQSPPPMGNDVLDKYINNMDYASNLIKGWLMAEYADEAAGLIARARANNIELKFVLVSSLGSNPVENNDDSRGKLTEGLRPMRVMDPLFAALDFQSRPKGT